MELRWSPERVSDLPKVTELVSGRMEVAGLVAGKRHRELGLRRRRALPLPRVGRQPREQ